MTTPQKQVLEQGETLALVGLGLMGGSLALAVRERMQGVRIVGWARRQEALDEAAEKGVIDSGSTDAASVLSDADITVICLPLQPSIAFAHENAPCWRKGALVTDVGSVKGRIMTEIYPCLRAHGVCFVGAHPMTGSERFGLEHATAGLYEQATVLVTPGTGVDAGDEAVCRTAALWEAVGCKAFLMGALKHDRVLAGTSHAVHLLASMAVKAFLSDPDCDKAAGGGFRDFTRIAASSPDMWTQITEHNREHILQALDGFSDELKIMRRCISGNDWTALHQYLNDARRKRQNWLEEWTKRRSQCEH